ncbi:ANTAR domain-containing protein [Actinophytocola algeriensis]|nr:ANTAR domain-containing protein [Actinophytocola algeriensis]
MVDHGMISPDWKPLVILLEDVLGRLFDDLAPQEPVGATITVGHRAAGEGYGLVRLANVGAVGELVDAQIEQLGGPVLDAVASDLPVTTDDVWADSRWPALTRQAMKERTPHLYDTWSRIRGVAALAAGWDGAGVLVLSCCVTGPADETVLSSLRRYEALAAATLAVVYASTTDGSPQVLAMLRSRGVIEQAKGAIMDAVRCDADAAWRRLSIASQHLNVKLRDLAMVLVEYLGNAPAEQPTGLPSNKPDTARGVDAAKLWQILTEPGSTESRCSS